MDSNDPEIQVVISDPTGCMSYLCLIQSLSRHFYIFQLSFLLLFPVLMGFLSANQEYMTTFEKMIRDANISLT